MVAKKDKYVFAQVIRDVIEFLEIEDNPTPELTPEVFKKLYWDNRDKSVWEKNKNGEWKLKDNIGNYADSDLIKEVSLEKIEECEFILTDKSESDENESEYLLMGRNYINKNNFGSVQNKIDGRSMTKRKWKEKNT